MYLNESIRVMLASNSKFLLEGIHKIFEDRQGLKIVAEAQNREEIHGSFVRIKPDFLFLDNRTLGLDIHKLLAFIIGNNPSSKVILLNGRKKKAHNYPNLISIDNKTHTKDLIKIIKSNRKYRKGPSIIIKGHRKSAKRRAR
jgi:DNA-binding NarL/FixJ family response regulator